MCIQPFFGGGRQRATIVTAAWFTSPTCKNQDKLCTFPPKLVCDFVACSKFTNVATGQIVQPGVLQVGHPWPTESGGSGTIEVISFFFYFCRCLSCFPPLSWVHYDLCCSALRTEEDDVGLLFAVSGLSVNTRPSHITGLGCHFRTCAPVRYSLRRTTQLRRVHRSCQQHSVDNMLD